MSFDKGAAHESYIISVLCAVGLEGTQGLRVSCDTAKSGAEKMDFSSVKASWAPRRKTKCVATDALAAIVVSGAALLEW